MNSQIRELAHANLFGKPGHGAPTENIRKKKFTEYQLADEENHLTDGFSQDDSALPDHPQPNYNPYPRPPAYENSDYGGASGGMMMTRHLSKSEPDISPVSYQLVNLDHEATSFDIE